MTKQRGISGWLAAVLIAALVLGGMPHRSRAAAAPAEAEAAPVQAAFVRDGGLWVQTGDTAKQVTKDKRVRNPKWSFDNQWIAYTVGETEQELRVLNVSSGKSKRVSAKAGAWSSFQWAPDQNRLAFLEEQRLEWADPKKPDRHLKVAEGIGNYSWLPDGQGFLASTAAAMLPDNQGWSPVRIVKLPLSPEGEALPAVPVYTLPKPSDEFLAVGTSIFRWSADRQWVAFLATPTASLSADSNTLCILSADGETFRKLDEMAHNESWFGWAPNADRLAYIGGVGREASSNKQLKVLDVPRGRPSSFTPAGSVDQGFAWDGPNHLIAVRAPEQKPSASGPAVRPFPALVDVNLATGQADTVTAPSEEHGDYAPTLATPDRLGWVRSDRKTAQVLLMEAEGDRPRVWIPSLDMGDSYYEQWHWNTVLDFAHSKEPPAE